MTVLQLVSVDAPLPALMVARRRFWLFGTRTKVLYGPGCRDLGLNVLGFTVLRCWAFGFLGSGHGVCEGALALRQNFFVATMSRTTIDNRDTSGSTANATNQRVSNINTHTHTHTIRASRVVAKQQQWECKYSDRNDSPHSSSCSMVLAIPGDGDDYDNDDDADYNWLPQDSMARPTKRS